MKTSKADRIKAEKRGKRAESLAALVLLLKGYRILARGWRAHPPHSPEIDIVARRGRLIAFIEVKARASRDVAIGAITPRQWSHIAAAAAVFVQRHQHLGDCDWRFDAVLVSPRRLPLHIHDAWRP